MIEDTEIWQHIKKNYRIKRQEFYGGDFFFYIEKYDKTDKRWHTVEHLKTFYTLEDALKILRVWASQQEKINFVVWP